MGLASVQKMGFAALIMAGSILLSRLMGLVRDKVVSWNFGAASEADIYFAAFTVPDFLNYLLAGGYISITLIPLLSRRFEEDREDGWRFFSAIFCWLSLGIGVCTLLAWIAAPELARLVGPGFSAEEQARLGLFLRIILPAQIFFLPGACVTALLYIRKQFFVPALTPLVYNGCIIAGGLIWPGEGMEGFCWGVLVGAALGAFLLPVIAARVGAARTGGAPEGDASGGGLRLAPVLRHPLLGRFLLLALPLMVGVSVVVMDEQFVRIFGSMAGEGAVSLLNYARRIMLVPVGVVAQAAGVASYPFLSSLAAKGDEAGFERTLNTALRGSLLIVLPLTALMIAVAGPTLGLLFEGGRFSAGETLLAAPLLQLMLLSVPFWVIQQIVGRAFYARQDTLRPAVVGSLVTLAVVPFYPPLARNLGAPGVALLTSLSLFAYTLALGLLWAKRQGWGAFRGLLRPVVRSLCLAAPCAVLAHFCAEKAAPGLRAVMSDPTGFPGSWLTGIWGGSLVPVMAHGLTLALGFCVFAVPYLLLAWRFLPEALRPRRR